MNNKGKTKESKKKKPSLDLVAVVVSFISLLAALGILWIIKRYKLPDDAVIVALIFLLPILIYLIISGTLAEFSAPGGWQVKFKQEAKKPLKDLNDLDFIRPRPLTMRNNFMDFSEDDLHENPNVLKVFLEEVSEFSPLCEYLQNIIIGRLGAEAIRYIVFFERTNSREKFVALLPVTSISVESGLRTPDGICRAYELVEWIVQKEYEKLSRLIGYVAREDSASINWSKSDCLRELSRKNLDALPLIKDDRLIGIVDRTRLLTSMLVDVTAGLVD